jgi:hypothetical protein
LGAGTLNHRRYESPRDAYDVVEPFRKLFDGRPETAQARSFFDDVRDIPADRRYHRIVSIAVLEHMTNLPTDIARAVLHPRPDGIFQAGIPSEGGLLWWISWRFSTGISYRLRTGLDYGVVMRHEHGNGAPECRSGRSCSSLPRTEPGTGQRWLPFGPATRRPFPVHDRDLRRAHGAVGLDTDPGAVVLRHAVNLGQGAALQTGIRYALSRGADRVVTFDADGRAD